MPFPSCPADRSFFAWQLSRFYNHLETPRGSSPHNAWLGALVFGSIIDRLLDVHGIRQGKLFQLLEGAIRWLCSTAQEVFMAQPVLLDFYTPIGILGDIHGQYHDLFRCFDVTVQRQGSMAGSR